MLGNDIFLWWLPSPPILSENPYLFKTNNKNKQLIDSYLNTINNQQKMVWKRESLKTKRVPQNHGN